MATDSVLARFATAAATSPSAARKQGESYSLANVGRVGEAKQRRKKLLEQAIATGKIKKDQLGVNDAGLLGVSVNLPQAQVTPGGGGGGGILGGVGRFLGNFGQDIFNAGRYLPAGVYNVGKSAIADTGYMLTHPGQLGGKNSQFVKNVAAPTAASYKETYGHGAGHFLGEFYKHPLGPVLDAATLLSLGGAAGARAGGLAVRSAEPGSVASRLGQKAVGITSREGRDSFIHPTSGREYPREYTPRPVAKLGQRGLDLLTKTGAEENWLGGKLRGMEQRRETRRNDALIRAGEWDLAGHAMQGLEPIAKLTPDEATALNLAQRGVNSADKINAFQKMVHDTSIDDPANLRALANEKDVSEAYVRHMGALPDNVKNLILHPNERMLEAHAVWKDRVRKQQEELGITDEQAAKHLSTEQERLAPYMDTKPGIEVFHDTKLQNVGPILKQGLRPSLRGIFFGYGRNPTKAYGTASIKSTLHPKNPLDLRNDKERSREWYNHWYKELRKPEADVARQEGYDAILYSTHAVAIDPSIIKYGHGPEGPPHPIEHVYTPTEVASGFQKFEPNDLQRFLTGAEDTFRRGPTDKSQFVTKGTRYDQAMFVPRKAPHEYHSTGETFASGAFRTDARLFLDHVAKRSRENADELWKRSEFNRIAAKDENGDIKYYKNQSEVNAEFGKGKMVFVNDEMPQVYFRKEQQLIEDVANIIDKYLEDAGPGDHFNPMNDPALESLITRMVDEDANAFIKTHWGSMKRKGGAIPADEFEYRMRMAKLDEPFSSGAARLLTRWMHRWRTAVLTLMPRWGLNTALGSIVMNTIRGVNPNDYWIAQRLHKAGFLPEDLAQAGHATAMPTGASLGHQMTQEMLEAAAPGYGQRAVAQYMGDLGIKLPVRKMAQGVQNIENYFRRAQFVHNLRREQRLGRDAEGRTIDLGDDGTTAALGGIQDQLQSFYDDVLGPQRAGKIGPALMNPKFVDRALKETDKFMYNYSVLGPFERRVVRQFIPFWGWYKFITMAAYRMPVELPGRMNLIRLMDQIAAEQESEMGPLPEWLKGNLPLGLNNQGTLKYLSTMGMNPLAGVANPLGPMGPLGGALTLGQTSPLLQAAMLGYGIDPLTGGQVAISPQEGVGTDPFGNLWKNGQQVSPMQVSPLRRIGMGLLRSFPEFRLAERYVLNPGQGFGSNYPESVPIIAPRPMGPIKGQVGLGQVALQSTGVGMKQYDLANYQPFAVKMGKYAAKGNITQQVKLRNKLRKKPK